MRGLGSSTISIIIRGALAITTSGVLTRDSLPLDFFDPPFLGRAGFEQKIVDKNPLVVNDDVVSFPLTFNLMPPETNRVRIPTVIDHLQYAGEFPVGQLPALCVPEGQEVL